MPFLWDRNDFSRYLQATLAGSSYRAHDPEALEFFNHMLQSAHDALESDRLEEGCRCLSIAFAIIVDIGKLGTPTALSVLRMLAECLHKSGLIAHAFAAYDLLGDLLVGPGDEIQKRIDIDLHLARIAGDASRDTRVLFEDASEIYEASLKKLESTYMHQGDALNGLKYGYELLKHQIDTYGDGHVQVAMTAANLSTACMQLGVYRSAARFAKQALSIYQRIADPYEEAYALANHNLGCVLMREGHYEDAIETFRQSLEVAEKVFGSSDGRIREIRKQLEDARRSASNKRPVLDSLPGQAREVVVRPDGTVSHLYHGLPDSDNIEEVIQMGEALMASGVPRTTSSRTLPDTGAKALIGSIPPLPPLSNADD